MFLVSVYSMYDKKYQNKKSFLEYKNEKRLNCFLVKTLAFVLANLQTQLNCY